MESDISYPLDGGRESFSIEHGDRYYKFFSDMGRCYFIIVLLNSKIHGTISGVIKRVSIANKSINALYVADLKVHPKSRGYGLPSKMIIKGLRSYLTNSKYRDWSLLFFVGMHGYSGDISKSFKGYHLGLLASPISKQRIYIVSPSKLSFINGVAPTTDFNDILELSPDKISKITVNSGKKDLRRSSDGSKILLAHVHPSVGKNFISDLICLSSTVSDKYHGHDVCFSIDNRHKDMINYLSMNGITTDTFSSIFVFRWPIFGPSLKNIEYVSISTSEI